MDVHPEHFTDFLLQNESVNLRDVQSDTAAEAYQALRVVIAHIIGIVSTNAFGIDVIAEDHTCQTLLALRGESAFDFYEEHLRSPNRSDPITDPYALNASWFRSYLFVIDSVSPITIDGNQAYVVNNICMMERVVDQFFEYQMSENDAESYRMAKALAFPVVNVCGNSGVRVSPYGSIVLGLGMGTRRRIYAPFTPHY